MSYITANLRPEDKTEAEAVLGPVHHMDLALAHLGPRSYVVEIDGNPEAAFGASKAVGDHIFHAWMFGTKRAARAVPAVVRFCNTVMWPDLIEAGAQRVEARAMASHFTAHRWLELMGARRRCELPCYGRGGETFYLYDWTRDHDRL